MRALEPATSGTLEVVGFQVAYEVFGEDRNPPVLLFPSWQIVHSRMWKLQVPHLARSFQVVTFDIPGNGRAERTTNPAAFEMDRCVDYGIGLLDHLQIDRAHVVGLSRGGAYSLWAAARYPERIQSAVLIGTALPESSYAESPGFWQRRERYEGSQKRNGHYWHEDYDGWLRFFFGHICSEPHSTKPFDDLVSWGHETTPEILVQTVNNEDLKPRMPLDEALQRVQCPVLLIHGTEDCITPIDNSRSIAAKRPDFTYLEMEGSGHAPIGRDPVKINQVISEFLEAPRPHRQAWRRAMSRDRKRVLFMSSPIGLGHVHRDLAIARELRKLVPDIEIDWLAQHPVTAVLERAGERIHPRSRELANESAHWEDVAAEHELHCFYAFREMDEILLANFMVFLDAAKETPYDLWIGDEAWELDHFLHENPELKTAPYVFMTDFVGFLPIDGSPGSREAFLTADYNAEMIEHIDRYPRIRDRALYIGEFDDIAPRTFGPGLPDIRAWTEAHFTAVGYVLPFQPQEFADSRSVRQRLGYEPDRPLVMAAAGGTATGRHLLRKTIDAWPLVQREMPEAKLVVTAGPRVDPGSFSDHLGLEIKPYVHNLYEHLAVADLGVVQGGLSTTMELAANQRPFLYFPLKNHFEQVYHVTHRLDRHRAGKQLSYHEISVEDLAAEILRESRADTSDYRPVVPGAAERAAREIASLL